MDSPLENPACPMPDTTGLGQITLAHGEGGRLMRQLIGELIQPQLDNEFLATREDAAALPPPAGPLAVTTDSFVVSPLFFPGGDIGSLAVYGTINDLAVSGARPLWISLAMIIEEGLAASTLARVISSIAAAAQRVGVLVVTGDTKVVPRGAADQLFLNTTGIGEFVKPPPPGTAAIEPGDAILVSGPIGRHGMAVMTSREGFDFDPAPTSDSAPLSAAVLALQDAECKIRAMRDATRGGVAAVLHEWAEASGHTFCVDEAALPISPEVRGVCELLGLDPIHVACEGAMLIAVPHDAVSHAIDVLRSETVTAQATRIGEVRLRSLSNVVIRRAMCTEVPVDEPLGAPLPRIC